jgi:Na+/H+ antiporter NhaC
LYPEKMNAMFKQGWAPQLDEDYVYEVNFVGDIPVKAYFHIVPKQHWKYWSLFPAFVALMLCWVTKEPISALIGGIICGAFILGQYDITDTILIPKLMTESSANIIVLYLWLLAALLGIWSKTGAARAFADHVSLNWVRGPKSAKVITWMLGMFFFQGGTMSAVLAGTTAKPISDRENVSHEELSFIVDSTSSPVASQIGFNAWPGYVQSFLYITGVSFLATEADRIGFFFKSVPFCLYAILIVLASLLFSLEKLPFMGKMMKAASERSRNTHALDEPFSEPLSAREITEVTVPEGYKPSVSEFIFPLLVLIGISIGTFFIMGVPKIRWAFSASIVFASIIALLKGMRIKELMDGITTGIKGISVGVLILLLAIVIGSITEDAGGPIYLIEQVGGQLPYWLLPVSLFVLAGFISFCTGTSWGTYAVALPIAMPLAWDIATINSLGNPQFFMLVCFAAVMDGGIFGDQCSPISDTTVLTSICTGTDLMDHVKTQMPISAVVAVLAMIGWTIMVMGFA